MSDDNEAGFGDFIGGVGRALLEQFPLFGALLGGVDQYHQKVRENQRVQFLTDLVSRLEKLERKETLEWYKSTEGEAFANKVIATALNAEYADKTVYLANVLINGPTLSHDELRRLKFLEMIRHISKPAIEVLVAALKHTPGSGQINTGDLATFMDVPPAIVDSCESELRAIGALSTVKAWSKTGGTYIKSEYRGDQSYLITQLTRDFVEFVSGPILSGKKA